MNDGPPADQFPEDRGVPAQRSGGGGKKQQSFHVPTEMKAFYAQLDNAQFRKELAGMLDGTTASVDAFIRTAKTAVQGNTDLLKPDWRPSLMQCTLKAAAQGLLPDGKHSAFIPRKDNASGNFQVCYQPMVWGITQLGRRAGALDTLSSGFVFKGENYRMTGGLHPDFTHEIDPIIVDDVYENCKDLNSFLEQMVVAYCVITAPNGKVTWRYMTSARIRKLRSVSKAANGPWAGLFFDEMILARVILFTGKYIDIAGDTPDMVRFRGAMEHDAEEDFDGEGGDDTPAATSGSNVAALPAPTAMDRLSQQLSERTTAQVTGAGEQEKVAVETRQETAEQKPQQQPQPDQAAKEQQRQQTEQRQDNATGTQQPQTKANTGEEQAKAFAAQMKKDIWEVAALTGDGESALLSLCTNDKNARGIGRLRVSYRQTYDWVLVSFLQPGVIDKIGRLQEIPGSVLYDDIIAASQKQAA